MGGALAKRLVWSGAEVCRLLKGEGFVQVRQRGSHCVMQRAVGKSTITVPVPMHKELRAGTLASIIRQSGVDPSRFEAK